ncbi:hemoblobin-interacting domain-containing protein [Hominenteromicrobium sp.]|uniref:hemoblobin-interacting domain-containing protein n=1 Tax=Hominenteromicrobium sp. TaxID=3073581 RepID=UPI003AB243B3
MRNIYKKAASLLLVTMILLSMVVTGAVAEAAAPTEVKSCEKSGFYTTVLNFEFSDTTWLDAVNGVTVNGTAFTGQTISSFSNDTGIWCVGNATGAYGSYKALQLAIENDASFPLTVEVTAAGYNKLTMEVAKATVSYNDVYTATVKISETEPTTPPTEPTKEPTPVEDTDPPTSFTASSNFGSDFNLTFSGAYDWLNSITAVQVNGTAWEKASSSFGVSGNSNYYVRPGNEYEDGYLYIGEGFDTNPATCVITATGYKPLTLTLDKTNHTATVNVVEEITYKAYAAKAENGSVSLSASEGIKKGETVTVTVTPDVDYELDTLTVKTESKEVETKKVSETSYTFAMPAANVTVTAKFKASALKVVDIDKVTLTEDTFGNDWHINFSEPSDYVENVTGFKVNGISWEEKSYNVSSGGAYRKYADDNYIQIAQKSYSASENEVPVRSGDVITISAKGYEDLNLKFVVDTSGKASLVADDGEGDPYELHVKIEGSFEAAIVGQKDYDGVSGASTGGSTSNSNSNVTVYGVLVEKDKEPTDDDWQKLDNNSQIDLNGSKCKVSIVPDVESGTPEDADSGMSGVYMPISSDLTLSGTPKDAGKYLVSVSIEDKQGRKATSNTLPFMIYTGEETLAEQIKIENLKQYANGLYAWDIMEPWAIKNFGSNVDGEEESVRVPADLEVWFGSHESGTYGYLGYDLAWDEVEAGNIPQTLYIPAGCNLTLTNMEILSSVRIVVEDGGKLTLDDSVVQGIIDVQGGGTFSMNYRAYSGEFKTGASVCGQIRLADGAILENAAIYSHANYLANGDLTDRTTSEPVVVTNGNVAVKGQVFIEGDDAGNEIGQTALQVNGTLTLADGATLVAYGGGGMTYFAGGTAIDLNGTITGNGKLVAIGGAPLFGDGGTAISGSGTISTSETFLQGGTAFTSRDAKPGKALNGDITLTSQSRHVKDGTLEETGTDDPLKALYWNTGIELIPPLDTFTTEQHTDAVTDTTVWKFDENTHWNPCDDVTCSVHVNEAAHTFVWVNDEAESDISTRSIEARTKHEECTVCGYTRNENTPITPDPVVTPEPSAKPTAEPTTAPTTEPSVTPAPTTEPTATPAPTTEPTATPASTTEPTTTPAPTAAPSAAATVTPVPNNNNGSNTPKTGSDYIAVIFSISLLTVSGAAIAALVLLSKKRGKHVAK